MTLHYYFLPMERAIYDNGTSRRWPKYLVSQNNIGGLQCKWSIIDYGLIDIAFAAADTDIVQHQTLFDQVDVLSIDPRNGNKRDLDVNATQGEIDALVSYLDVPGNFVPMGWATVSDTRRAILRGICGIFLFVQRVTGVSRMPPTEWGITLATTWTQLTEQQRGWLREAATTLGFTVSDPAGNTSIRQILKYMGDNWGTRPIYMGFSGQL